MKIYISGKITGLPPEQVKAKFEKAEKFLKDQGMIPVNPLKIEQNSTSWEEYMKADIIELMKCNAIFLLSDYKQSRGALLEYHIATQLKFYVLHEKEGYF